jgi:hypothetical protein
MKTKLLFTTILLLLIKGISAQTEIIPDKFPLYDKESLSDKMLSPISPQATDGTQLRSATSTATDLGNGVFTLSSAEDPNSSLAVITVSDTQWKNLISSSTYYSELQTLSKLAYTKFNDSYDFIFFVLDTVQSTSILSSLGFYGVNCSVSNAVQGLGRSIFNYSSYWGSSGNLKSVMYFPYSGAILSGPTLHELCHNWAAFICPTYNKDNSSYSGHWGVSNAGGQLGGFRYIRLVETNSGGVTGKTKYQASFKSSSTNTDGSFVYGGFGVNANGGNGLPYSDIELYLMGMKSAQELRDNSFRLDIYSGNEYDAATYSSGYFYSTTVTSYTIDDIIASKGARVPDASSSQKNFKILTVAITRSDFATHQYSSIISAVNWLAGSYTDNTYSYLYNFRQATYNKGTLETTGISSTLKSTSVNEQKESSFKVIPGVVKNNFVVSGFEGRGILKIYDLNGKLLLDKQVNSGESIQADMLSSGLYLLRLQTAGSTLQTKIIKE